MKERNSKPEIIAMKKARKQSLEFKERMRIRNQRPEVKAKKKEYRKRPKLKEQLSARHLNTKLDRKFVGKNI